MSVGILIVTHGNIGQAILDTAIDIIGSSPMQAKAINIDMDCDYDTLLNKVDIAGEKLDSGDGVLVLTDLFGSTPSNIASAITIQNSIVIAGLNLPMLIRLMNYYNLPLYELSDKAIDGGKDGILASYNDKNKNHDASTN